MDSRTVLAAAALQTHCRSSLFTALLAMLCVHSVCSQFNLEGRIGGDSNLAPLGEEYAAALPEMLMDRLPVVRSADGLLPGRDGC
jgi:hypothetical protein